MRPCRDPQLLIGSCLKHIKRVHIKKKTPFFMKEEAPSCPITPLPKQIGPYKILKKIASGGMGEVFVAQDPLCKRTLALKKIRTDRMHQEGLKERFLKEVKIAAQLSHPSIIPIYQIHQTESEIYYTMPLVEGETLKEILRKTLYEEKQGFATHPIGSSIPALMRIFLNICQAIAYSHARGILHRDLKPENIIIGKYGEVLILDWGLADFANNCLDEIPLEDPLEEIEMDLTRPGKIAGTLSYLPPERIFGKKATYASDIYALGVILYQLLTLRLPFKRKSVKEYRKQAKHDLYINPAERAPHRDIPPQLSKIAKKCLASRIEKRYLRVQDILKDLNNYIEGHAEWSPCASVQIENKNDWEFQENILLAKHISLTQKSDSMEWVSLMMARQSFPGNIKFETHVRMKEHSRGVGLVLNMKSFDEKKDFFQDGFFLWIGSESNPGCFLFRSSVEVMESPELCLKQQMSHFIKIEKTDNHFKFYLDNILIFDYLSHIPLNTPHFGVLLKDEEFEIGAILISSSSPNILINCLSVPDRLFALHEYKESLMEYRQIARSFLGRAEGREAIFRSGITLLEMAQNHKKKEEKNKFFEQALDEFSKLKNTPGAPLEYLGKSLVYKASFEIEEEVKCLELSLRKFEKHPLMSLIKDQILFRLYEASYKERMAAYHFALLALRFMPEAFSKPNNKKLLEDLKKRCEPLSFLLTYSGHIELELAFYLNKPFFIEELLTQKISAQEKTNAIFCLLNLGHPELAQKHLEELELRSVVSFYEKGLIKTLEDFFTDPSLFISRSQKQSFLFFLSFFYKGSSKEKKALIEKLEEMCNWEIPEKERLLLRQKLIEFSLFIGNVEKAVAHLSLISSSEKELESSPFYFLHACSIASKNVEKAQNLLCRHVEQVLPPSYCLIDYYLADKTWEKKWLKKAFSFEKKELLKQLFLFYKSARLEKKATYFYKKFLKEA